VEQYGTAGQATDNVEQYGTAGQARDNVEQYGTAGQATDSNLIRPMRIFIKDYQGYRHPLRICNSCCFSTAKIVTRTPLNITLYAQCLSCHVTRYIN